MLLYAKHEKILAMKWKLLFFSLLHNKTILQPTDPHTSRIKFHHSIINAAGHFFIDIDAYIWNYSI